MNSNNFKGTEMNFNFTFVGKDGEPQTFNVVVKEGKEIEVKAEPEPEQQSQVEQKKEKKHRTISYPYQTQQRLQTKKKLNRHIVNSSLTMWMADIAVDFPADDPLFFETRTGEKKGAPWLLWLKKISISSGVVKAVPFVNFPVVTDIM